MGKKRNLFLWLSFTVFILSVIAVILHMFFSYYQVKTDFPNDTQRITDELVAMVFVSACITVPCLGSQLSCIRSIYKVFKHRPQGFVKICYVVSFVVAFLAFSFHWLNFFGFINLEAFRPEENFTVTLQMCIQWPVFIASFILGSIPMKHKDQ